MTTKVQEVINEIEGIRFPQALFITTIDQLLQTFPEFAYANAMKDKADIYHDLKKKSTPQGIKNTLKYDEELLREAVASELLFLVKVRNAIKKILCVVKAARNKKFILSILEQMFNMALTTGGGTSPCVKRIIKIYEREGNVKVNKKRKGEEGSDELDETTDNGTDTKSFSPVAHTESELTAKKLKTVEYPLTDECEELSDHEWMRMFDFLPTDNTSIVEGLPLSGYENSDDRDDSRKLDACFEQEGVQALLDDFELRTLVAFV